ncbi:MAG: hypothetical protein K6V97_11330 [Actinomycetia bacterium]|nr:hypothetical protein [Actinomycetes bacterium]
MPDRALVLVCRVAPDPDLACDDPATLATQAAMALRRAWPLKDLTCFAVTGQDLDDPAFAPEILAACREAMNGPD